MKELTDRDSGDHANDDDAADERRHYEEVCDSYRQYATFAYSRRIHHANRINAIPLEHMPYLPSALTNHTQEWEGRQNKFQKSELRNQFFIDSMLHYHGQPNSQDTISAPNKKWSTSDYISKVQSVLKSLARDWSLEGAEERSMSYHPILDSVRKYISLTPNKSRKTVEKTKKMAIEDKEENVNQDHDGESDDVLGTNTYFSARLCVPGAGLGRLALELASLGYTVQGNEFSMHMLLVSDFILNSCTSTKPYDIAPWIGSTCNIHHSLDPARLMKIPDVDPSSMIAPPSRSGDGSDMHCHTGAGSAEFSMAAGEFVSVYSKPSQKGVWDGVVACFFLDTAPSIVEYLRVIFDMLVDGGYLISFGPLLYHWSGPPARPDEAILEAYRKRNSHLDARYINSIDLSWEDIREVMFAMGFEITEERVGIPAYYTTDKTSLMNTEYKCVHLVARKTCSKKTALSN